MLGPEKGTECSWCVVGEKNKNMCFQWKSWHPDAVWPWKNVSTYLDWKERSWSKSFDQKSYTEYCAEWFGKEISRSWAMLKKTYASEVVWTTWLLKGMALITQKQPMELRATGRTTICWIRNDCVQTGSKGGDLFWIWMVRCLLISKCRCFVFCFLDRNFDYSRKLVNLCEKGTEQGWKMAHWSRALAENRGFNSRYPHDN